MVFETWPAAAFHPPCSAFSVFIFLLWFYYRMPRCPHLCKHNQTDYHCNFTALLQHNHYLHQTLPLMVTLILFLLRVTLLFSQCGNISMELIFFTLMQKRLNGKQAVQTTRVLARLAWCYCTFDAQTTCTLEQQKFITGCLMCHSYTFSMGRVKTEGHRRN